MRSARFAPIDPLIASHRGRIFNTAGDGLVADFASAVDAVECAVAVQEAITKENPDRPARGREQSSAFARQGDRAGARFCCRVCNEQRYLRGGMPEETRHAALHHARRAIVGGGDDASTLATAGFVIAVAGHDYETALTAFDRSFALSSLSALALSFSSIVRAWKGDFAIAVEHANRALRLSPFDPWLYTPYIGLAYAHFAARRFEETVAAVSLATQSNTRFTVPGIIMLPLRLSPCKRVAIER
jgi:tetratricopeptide (TPR) repeat protein